MGPSAFCCSSSDWPFPEHLFSTSRALGFDLGVQFHQGCLHFLQSSLIRRAEVRLLLGIVLEVVQFKLRQRLVSENLPVADGAGQFSAARSNGAAPIQRSCPFHGPALDCGHEIPPIENPVSRQFGTRRYRWT